MDSTNESVRCSTFWRAKNKYRNFAL